MRDPALRMLFAGVLSLLVAHCGPSHQTSESAYRSHTYSLSVPGAIFTTTPDGTIVNENTHYNSKLEFYLDGGPGSNAPATAAGLPDGEYYFQVTDPSGKVLLSEDPAKCRRFRVAGGVIVQLVAPAVPTYSVPGKKGPVTVACHVQDEPDGVAGPSGRHDTNTDADHGALGAIVVQLMPFFDTPNNGGVYKAWVITTAQYELGNGGDPASVPVPLTIKNKQVGYEPDPGFGPSRNFVKTDNFKVKQGKPCPVSLTVKKFHDRNINGMQDLGEEEILGWPIWIRDPLDVLNLAWTRAELLPSPPGIWTVTEELGGALQTVSLLNGQPTSLYPAANPRVDVTVAGVCGEAHEVVYGNICAGTVTACKYYDANRNAMSGAAEALLPGWRMRLSGTDVAGAQVALTGTTGLDGCVTFSVLPGSYTVAEEIPTTGGWQTVETTSKSVTVTSAVSGSSVECSDRTVMFGNYCVGYAAFNTKGYWHNKNGLSELDQPDIDHANTLAPYASPSSYFDAGDEPFDGKFADGTDVAEVNGSWGELIAGAGTAKAEISHFLVDPNAGGDPREQLAQQLLAFVLNTRHRLGGDTPIMLPDGSWSQAAELVNAAIIAWSGGTDAERTAMASLLDALNNSSAVPFVHLLPSGVTYP